MKQKLLRLILCLAILLSLVSVVTAGVCAAPGEMPRLTIGNTTYVMGRDSLPSGLSWDPQYFELVMNGYRGTQPMVFSENDWTVRLVGDNRIDIVYATDGAAMDFKGSANNVSIYSTENASLSVKCDKLDFCRTGIRAGMFRLLGYASLTVEIDADATDTADKNAGALCVSRAQICTTGNVALQCHPDPAHACERHYAANAILIKTVESGGLKNEELLPRVDFCGTGVVTLEGSVVVEMPSRKVVPADSSETEEYTRYKNSNGAYANHYIVSFSNQSEINVKLISTDERSGTINGKTIYRPAPSYSYAPVDLNVIASRHYSNKWNYGYVTGTYNGRSYRYHWDRFVRSTKASLSGDAVPAISSASLNVNCSIGASPDTAFHQLTLSNADQCAPVIWRILAGSLPEGVYLNPCTGQLCSFGEPAEDAQCTVQIYASNMFSNTTGTLNLRFEKTAIPIAFLMDFGRGSYLDADDIRIDDVHYKAADPQCAGIDPDSVSVLWYEDGVLAGPETERLEGCSYRALVTMKAKPGYDFSAVSGEPDYGGQKKAKISGISRTVPAVYSDVTVSSDLKTASFWTPVISGRCTHELTSAPVLVSWSSIGIHSAQCPLCKADIHEYPHGSGKYVDGCEDCAFVQVTSDKPGYDKYQCTICHGVRYFDESKKLLTSVELEVGPLLLGKPFPQVSFAASVPEDAGLQLEYRWHTNYGTYNEDDAKCYTVKDDSSCELEVEVSVPTSGEYIFNPETVLSAPNAVSSGDQTISEVSGSSRLERTFRFDPEGESSIAVTITEWAFVNTVTPKGLCSAVKLTQNERETDYTVVMSNDRKQLIVLKHSALQHTTYIDYADPDLETILGTCNLYLTITADDTDGHFISSDHITVTGEEYASFIDRIPGKDAPGVCLTKLLTPVDTVVISGLTAPAAGQTAGTPSAAQEKGNYSITQKRWYDRTVGGYLAEGETFRCLREYSEYIWVRAATGYALADPAKMMVTVDGKTIPADHISRPDQSDSQLLLIKYDFPMTEHIWGEAMLTCAPDCENEGTAIRFCTIPGCDVNGYGPAREISTLPAIGHRMTLVEGTPATCCASGYAEHYECSNCRKWYSDSDGNSEIEPYSIETLATGKHEDADEDGCCDHCGAAQLTVGGGTATAYYLNEDGQSVEQPIADGTPEYVPIGVYVVLEAAAPAEGKSFSSWSISEGTVTLDSVKNKNAVFSMPAAPLHLQSNYAEKATEVYVANVKVSDGNGSGGIGYWKNSAGGLTATGATPNNFNVSYDPENGVLTLDGLNVSVLHSATYRAVVWSDGDLQIRVKGASQINAQAMDNNYTKNLYGCGIYVTGSLELSGPGTLTVTGPDMTSTYTDNVNSYGLYVGKSGSDDAFTLGDGVSLTVKGGNTTGKSGPGKSYGTRLASCTLVVDDTAGANADPVYFSSEGHTTAFYHNTLSRENTVSDRYTFLSDGAVVPETSRTAFNERSGAGAKKEELVRRALYGAFDPADGELMLHYEHTFSGIESGNNVYCGAEYDGSGRLVKLYTYSSAMRSSIDIITGTGLFREPGHSYKLFVLNETGLVPLLFDWNITVPAE